MPELSDVEGFRRYFARHAAGRRIVSVEVADRALVHNTSPQGLGRALRGRRFARPTRHGKWLIAPTGGPELLMHFGMTGLLSWSADRRPHRHDRILFELAGTLVYRNVRRLGGLWLVAANPRPRRGHRVAGAGRPRGREARARRAFG